MQGLSLLHGSREGLAQKIADLLREPGTFQPGSYKKTIHEMEEMRALGMGQYAHNNQPVHHILFLNMGLDEKKPQCMEAARSGLSKVEGTLCPRLASEAKVHEVLERAYGVGFYGGDEDNGEMGSWYVLASVGLFETAPGTKHGYALGSPSFRHVDIYRKHNQKDSGPPSLSIFSHMAGGNEARHVTRVLLNSQDVGNAATDAAAGWTISYEDLLVKAVPGSKLRFLTGSEGIDEPPPAMVPAAAPAPPAPAAHDNGALQRLQQQLMAAQEERDKQQREQLSLASSASSSAQSQPQQPAQDNLAAQQARQLGQQVDQQQLQIRQLEAQLREAQLKEQTVRKLRATDKHDQELHAGLSYSVYMSAFGILVLANGAGWFICMQNRANKKARTRQPRTYGRMTNHRRKDEGLDV
jgi:hypothetical protein